MCATRPDLLKTSLIGLVAAGAALAFGAGLLLAAAFCVFAMGFPLVNMVMDDSNALRHAECRGIRRRRQRVRSEEHTSELQSLMRNSYAVFCLKKKKKTKYK